MHLCEQQGFIIELLQVKEPIPDKKRKPLVDHVWDSNPRLSVVLFVRLSTN